MQIHATTPDQPFKIIQSDTKLKTDTNMTYVKPNNTTPHPIDELLNYLFTDKQSVYVDDAVINADGSFEVSWCRDYTLYAGNPQWMDTHLERRQLTDFIRSERLNYWEAFRYDEQTGSVQPFENANPDIETFLDEHFREVISQYLRDNKMATIQPSPPALQLPLVNNTTLMGIDKTPSETYH